MGCGWGLEIGSLAGSLLSVRPRSTVVPGGKLRKEAAARVCHTGPVQGETWMPPEASRSPVEL